MDAAACLFIAVSFAVAVYLKKEIEKAQNGKRIAYWLFMVTIALLFLVTMRKCLLSINEVIEKIKLRLGDPYVITSSVIFMTVFEAVVIFLGGLTILGGNAEVKGE